MRFLWKSQIERGQPPIRRIKKIRRRLPRAGRPFFVFLAILWSLLFFTFVYSFFFSSYLLISQLSVHGTDKLQHDVEAFVKEELQGRYFSIWPRGNFLLLRPESLARKIENHFPLIRHASVSRVFPRKLEIFLLERPRILLWCSGGPCYLITEEGLARQAERALRDENRPYLRTIIDTSAQPVRLGQRLFSFDLPAFEAQATQVLEERLGLEFTGAYEASSRFANELRMRTTAGYLIYISTELPLEQTASALAIFLEKELTPEKRNELEYIDARAENRIYYVVRGRTEDSADIPPTDDKKEEKTEKKQKN